MRESEKAASGGLILLLRQVVSMLVGIVVLLVVTRIIGPEQYGSYMVAFGIYQFFAVVAQFSLEVFLNRRTSVDYVYISDVARALLLVSSSAAALLMFGIGELNSGLLSAESSLILQGLSPILFFQLLAVPSIIELERAFAYKAVAFIELASQLLGYAILIGLAFLGLGAWSLFAGWAVQQILTLVFAVTQIKRFPRVRWDAALIWEIAIASVSVSAANWAWRLRLLVTPFLVAPISGSAAAGQIGLAVTIVERIAVAKTVAWRISLNLLSTCSGDRKKTSNAIQRGMELQVLAIAPGYVLFSVFARSFEETVFGGKWSEAITLFPFVAIAYLVNASFSTQSAALLVNQRVRVVALFNTFNSLLLGAGAIICVPQMGILGYGVAELIALFSYFVIVKATRSTYSVRYQVTIIWIISVAMIIFREFAEAKESWVIAGALVLMLAPPSIATLVSTAAQLRKLARAKAR